MQSEEFLKAMGRNKKAKRQDDGDASYLEDINDRLPRLGEVASSAPEADQPDVLPESAPIDWSKETAETLKIAIQEATPPRIRVELNNINSPFHAMRSDPIDVMARRTVTIWNELAVLPQVVRNRMLWNYLALFGHNDQESDIKERSGGFLKKISGLFKAEPKAVGEKRFNNKMRFERINIINELLKNMAAAESDIEMDSLDAALTKQLFVRPDNKCGTPIGVLRSQVLALPQYQDPKARALFLESIKQKPEGLEALYDAPPSILISPVVDNISDSSDDDAHHIRSRTPPHPFSH